MLVSCATGFKWRATLVLASGKAIGQVLHTGMALVLVLALGKAIGQAWDTGMTLCTSVSHWKRNCACVGCRNDIKLVQ